MTSRSACRSRESRRDLTGAVSLEKSLSMRRDVLALRAILTALTAVVTKLTWSVNKAHFFVDTEMAGA